MKRGYGRLLSRSKIAISYVQQPEQLKDLQDRIQAWEYSHYTERKNNRQLVVQCMWASMWQRIDWMQQCFGKHACGKSTILACTILEPRLIMGKSEGANFGENKRNRERLVDEEQKASVEFTVRDIRQKLAAVTLSNRCSR